MPANTNVMPANTLPEVKIISDREIPHRADVKGLVVTRVQVTECLGKLLQVNFWTDWSTGRLHHLATIDL